jgi:hypothetical protein
MTREQFEAHCAAHKPVKIDFDKGYPFAIVFDDGLRVEVSAGEEYGAPIVEYDAGKDWENIHNRRPKISLRGLVMKS